MRRYVYVFVIVVIVALQSCREDLYSPPEFPLEKESAFELLSDVLYFNIVSDIWEYGDYLLVCAYDRKNNRFFHVYDKRTGAYIDSYVSRGRGPGEIFFGHMNTSFNGGVISFFDVMSGSVVDVSVDSMASGRVNMEEKVLQMSSGTFYVGKVKDGYVCVMSKNPYQESVPGESRFELRDEAFNIVDKSDFAPALTPEQMFVMYVHSSYAVSPDMTRFCIASEQGAILEIYTVDSAIRNNVVKYFYEPDFDVLYGTYDFNERTVLGFSDVFATNDRLFTVYDGEVNPFRNGGDRQMFTRIAVFDWDGNPLELIHTDYSIDKIAYSEAENTIYAAVADSDRIMYLAKMEL